MVKIGFDLNNEFLPSFDKFNTIVNRRIMFLKLFNQEVSPDLKFTKREIREFENETLFNIFTKKILKNLKFSIYAQSSLVKVDKESTNKINKFLKIVGKKDKPLYNFSLLNSYKPLNIYPSLKLINMLDRCNYSFYLDGNKIFKNFVSNKILRSKEDRDVYINPDSIDIKSEKYFFKTRIFTFWDFININKLNIDKHIKKAVDCIKTSEYKQVYLVYPKNENFNKHVQIRSEELQNSEYIIKLIPYSMRSTLR